MKDGKNMKINTRSARPDDAAALLDIYSPYIIDTAITFEYDVPTVLEFKTRIENIISRYPYLVAEIDGKIVGYAYATEFHKRAAYDYAVETSIYVDMAMRGKGIGKVLHNALEKELRERGFLNMNACIAYAPVEDEYLTNESIGFHKHMEYRMVGEFYKCGYKFDRWYNMVWMEKLIGEHKKYPKHPF